MYSVYNSQGGLMLYTSNESMARSIADSFKQHPQTEQIVVQESRSSPPKRA
jgi:hypothetical protein